MEVRSLLRSTLQGRMESKKPVAESIPKASNYDVQMEVPGGSDQHYREYLECFANPARLKSFLPGPAAAGATPCHGAAMKAICIDGSPFLPVDARGNNAAMPRTAPLQLSAGRLNDSAERFPKDALEGLKIDWECLQKKWGGARPGTTPETIKKGQWDNGGTIKDNVYVVYDNEIGQYVIRLRATGDLVPGEGGADPKDPLAPPLARGLWQPSKTIPQCAEEHASRYPPTAHAIGIRDVQRVTDENCTYGNPYARTGAVLATRNVWGPARFTVNAKVNPTEWKEAQGRGYAFAIWTYGYTESYRSTTDAHPGHPGIWPQQGDPESMQRMVQLEDPSDPNSGRYIIHNSEIDIEIPGSSTTKDWDSELGWNTMNANTWVSDEGERKKDEAFYTQVCTEL